MQIGSAITSSRRDGVVSRNPFLKTSYTRNGIRITTFDHPSIASTKFALFIRGGSREETDETSGYALLCTAAVARSLPDGYSGVTDADRVGIIFSNLARSPTNIHLRSALRSIRDGISTVFPNPDFHLAMDGFDDWVSKGLQNFLTFSSHLLQMAHWSGPHARTTVGNYNMMLDPEIERQRIEMEHPTFRTESTYRSFIMRWLMPERIHVTAVGIEHQALVNIVEEIFGDLPEGGDWRPPAVTYNEKPEIQRIIGSGLAIGMGFRVPSDDAWPVEILRMMLPPGGTHPPWNPSTATFV